MQMQLALKIDVDTWRGTRDGVPRLVEALQRHGADATFLFSLGPDHTGRALKRIFRKGFLKKVRRTKVTSHYGLTTLMYGTLLPGPDIGIRCFAEMQAVRDAGFEVGIHCWDHVKWQDGVATADQDWTESELKRAVKRFGDVFGMPPKTHGAAGWQMNRSAYRLEQRLGFDYASDGRGSHPFMPVIEGEPIRCPQIPTTLPTLDELLGVDGVDESNVAQHLLRLTGRPSRHPHVFTLHAELEGNKLLPVFESLLDGWREQGYQFVSTRTLFNQLELSTLPWHEVLMEEIPGRSGLLAVQGPKFPS